MPVYLLDEERSPREFDLEVAADGIEGVAACGVGDDHGRRGVRLGGWFRNENLKGFGFDNDRPSGNAVDGAREELAVHWKAELPASFLGVLDFHPGLAEQRAVGDDAGVEFRTRDSSRVDFNTGELGCGRDVGKGDVDLAGAGGKDCG